MLNIGLIIEGLSSPCLVNLGVVLSIFGQFFFNEVFSGVFDQRESLYQVTLRFLDFIVSVGVKKTTTPGIFLADINK